MKLDKKKLKEGLKSQSNTSLDSLCNGDLNITNYNFDEIYLIENMEKWIFGSEQKVDRLYDNFIKKNIIKSN